MPAKKPKPSTPQPKTAQQVQERTDPPACPYNDYQPNLVTGRCRCPRCRTNRKNNPS